MSTTYSKALTAVGVVLAVILLLMVGLVWLALSNGPKTDPAAICWSPDTKASVTALAKRMTISRLTQITYNTNAQYFQDRVEINLSGFHAQNEDGKSTACGANISLKMRKNSGGYYTSEGIVLPFNVFKGESGPVVSIQQVDINNVIHDADR